jgi:guanylate kinase
LAEPEDKEEVVKTRFHYWQLNLSHLEETYKQMLMNVQSDRTVEQVETVLSDGIQNPPI